MARKKAMASKCYRGNSPTHSPGGGLAKAQYRWGKFLAAYTVLFLVTFVLACSPFFAEGRTLIWSASDGHTQHYPALAYIGRYLRQLAWNFLHGDFSIPLFDLSLAMGGDVISTLNYYGFGDPLNLLSVFTPTHYIEGLYNFLVMLRLYLAGLSFCYLCAYHKKPLSHALAGALIYVFSGYMTYSAFAHPFFLNPMIQLPLLLVGIDMVIRGKRPFVFILSVFYAAVCGFYFLYIMTVLLGIYTLIRFWACYGQRRVRAFFCMVGRIIGTYALGIGLGGVIFFPAVIGFLTSSRSSAAAAERNYFFYSWEYYRNSLFKLVAPPGSWDALTVAALAFFAVLLLLGKRRRYRTLKLLLAACVLLYVLPLGGYVLNGFSYPVQRWTFAAALLLAYVTVELLPDLLGMEMGQQLICLGATVLYAAFVFLCALVRNIYNVVGVAMLAITLAVLFVGKELRREQGKQALALALCIGMVAGNTGVNVMFKLARGQGGAISQHKEWGEETQLLETAIELDAQPYLKNMEGRMDSSSFSLNMGAVWHVPNMYTYWSVMDQGVSRFGRETEDAARRYASYVSYGVHERTGIEALFSTKYFIERKDREQYVPYGYDLLAETKQGNLVYENRYALPWGYTYDSYMTDDSLTGQNGLTIAQAMLQHIVLEDDMSAVPVGVAEDESWRLEYSVRENGDITWEDGILTVGKNNAVMTLEFQMPPGVEGYLRLQGMDLSESGLKTSDLKVTCNNVSRIISATGPTYTWYAGQENYLAHLGYSDEARTICTITFPKKGTYGLEDLQFFALPMDKYPTWIEALRTEPLENIQWATNRVSGTLDISKNKILCMSIPYSRGWTATVDGEKVDILRGNYMFLCVSLEAGHHDVVFTYCSPGLKVGMAAFALSLGVVLYLVARDKGKRRKNEPDHRCCALL